MKYGRKLAMYSTLTIFIFRIFPLFPFFFQKLMEEMMVKPLSSKTKLRFQQPSSKGFGAMVTKSVQIKLLKLEAVES
jgi:hypothetical protein